MNENQFFFLISQQTQRTFLPVKILFLFFSLLMLGMIIYLLKITDWLKYSRGINLKEFGHFRAAEASALLKKWKKTKLRLSKRWESEAKLAIVEADGLLNEVLERTGYQGESLEQRLEQIDQSVLPNIEQILEARKIRNEIVNDPNYKIDLSKAKQIVKIYEQALQDLNAL